MRPFQTTSTLPAPRIGPPAVPAQATRAAKDPVMESGCIAWWAEHAGPWTPAVGLSHFACDCRRKWSYVIWFNVMDTGETPRSARFWTNQRLNVNAMSHRAWSWQS